MSRAGEDGATGGNGAGLEVQGGSVEGVGGLRLRTLVWLPAAVEPGARLLLVHGLGEHAGRYEEVGRFLASRGVATVAWDQRGHGESEGRRGVLGSFEELVGDVDRVTAFADREVPTRHPFLLGHSLGGLVALRHLQTRRPALDGCVLSSPWLGTAADVPLWKRLASRLLRRVAPELTLGTGLDGALLTRDPAKQREYDEDPLVHHRISAGLHRAVVIAQARALADRPDPAVPLLFVVPLGDRVADPEVTLRYADGLEGPVEVEKVSGGRHEPLNDVGRVELFRLLATWIAARRAENPSRRDGYLSSSPGEQRTETDATRP